MADPKIEAHKITKPIQLLAVWFVTLVLIDSALLIAARTIDTPEWVAPMLAIAAVVFVPTFLIAAFIMQTRYRTQLQDDSFYAEWLKRQERTFGGFVPENLKRQQQQDANGKLELTFDEYESRRTSIYEAQRGLFLVHAWRPSRTPGQVADIVIWLHQHRDGPLSKGAVEKVEYHLGPMFFDHVVTKYNRDDSFRLEVSAYGPMLCLARVFVRQEGQPVELHRYINFDESP